MHGVRIFATALLAMTVTAGAAPTGAAEKELAKIIFSAAERAIITKYYGDAGQQATRGKGAGKSKGNQGRGVGRNGMPPGLTMNGKLPPGIAMRQMPTALATQLPPPPTGFERAIIDNDVVLVEIATRIVHDILTDIVTK